MLMVVVSTMSSRNGYAIFSVDIYMVMVVSGWRMGMMMMMIIRRERMSVYK